MVKRKPGWVSAFAEQSMNHFLKMAEETGNERYLQLAMRMHTKYKIPLPEEYKRRICKKCGKMLVPGKNLTIRAKNKFLLYKCEECKNVKKYGYAKKKSTRPKTRSTNR